MKVFTALYGLADAAERARELRDAGASGVATFEGPHDVFAPLTLAATVGGLDLMTNVAIAFPRNPIHLAHQSNDHQLLSGGRFTLGLGTQIRPQIEKRFGAEFDRPVARMTELIAALRAIFEAWNTGGRLDFRGDYYRHTLMTPTFNPGPNPYGPPPIFVGALGPRLTRATAEHADGLLVMPFGSKRFLQTNTLPAVRAGLKASGRRAEDFRIIPEIIVSAGDTEEALERAAAGTRRLLAFYGSTPAYRPVLAAHGWEDLQPELNAMSKQGRWQEMAGLVDDEMMHTIAACGTPAQIAAHIRDRLDGVADSVFLYQAAPIGLSTMAEIIDELRHDGGDPLRPATPPSRSPQHDGGDPLRPATPPSRSPLGRNG
nr:TIGR03617 family F420-dependent LLM class oxidoreductase [Mycobacterium asiaticum]